MEKKKEKAEETQQEVQTDPRPAFVFMGKVQEVTLGHGKYYDDNGVHSSRAG
jgi:hypothetical protein